MTQSYPRMFGFVAGLAMTVLAGLATFNVRPAHAAPTTSISQIPLTIAIPQHPQVLFAVGNSQSMDGDLSGAIMTGSGLPPNGLVSLISSSSPINYAIPYGFTPPLNPGTGGSAPYTFVSQGTLYDNGPSRLNVAKEGIQAILNNYMQNTDFALMDYKTNGTNLYTTWVYYMSGANGFAFTNTPPVGSDYVINACYRYSGASASVNKDCKSIATIYASGVLEDNQYMLIAASSDDSNINDVLYAGGLPGIFVTYSGPHPSSPFPPDFTLANYNNGKVSLKYKLTAPSIGAFSSSPTNAGYVPYTPQVFQVERGFGYYVNGMSATDAHSVVPMTSAGKTPTQSSIQNAISKFASALLPETNSSSSIEIKALANQSAIAGLLQGAQSSLSKTAANNNSGCKPKQYVILLTDGLPTMDLDGNNWPPLGSISAQGYGVTASFNTNGSLKNTNDEALQDAITSLKNLRQAGIRTYVVGLGAGVDPTANPQAAATLKAMAIAGGSGNYIAATNPQALVSGLNNILIAIQAGSLSTSSAAVNSTGLNSGSVAYQASYTVSDTPYQDWTGNLQAFSIAASNGVVNTSSAPLWSAQALLDALAAGNGWNSQRLIVTWNRSLNSGNGAGVPFRWSALSTHQKTLLQPNGTLGQDSVHYLRGDTSLELRNGGTFRSRSHILGDIVDSNPIYVGVPDGTYGDASYQNFRRAEINRPAMLYVGADDGMLHAFSAATGIEKFAFVPNAVFSNLALLTRPLYNSQHHFYVNGSPQAGDVLFSNNSWHTILVSGEGAGGNSVFAMDISDPQNLTNESSVAKSMLWEFTDTDMGYSFSTPTIARIKATPGFAVFFGDGYNPPSNQPILYALNPQTGAVLVKINLCSKVPSACNSNLPNGLSGVVAGNTNGLLGEPINRVYAGDLQGNLWSINVSGSNPSQWTVSVLFQAHGPSGKPQAITTTPTISLNPNYPGTPGLMVFFGTGKLLGTGDLGTLQTQSFYGVLDDSPTSPYTRNDLQKQVITTLAPGQGGNGTMNAIRLITNNCINWTGVATPPTICPNNGQSGNPPWPTTVQKGWYMDLPGIGERSVTDPRIDSSGVVFTTYAPSNNLCTAGGQSFLMDVNYANGGSFSQPQFDINNSHTITSGDRVTSGGKLVNPAGMGLGKVYAAAPTIISANLGNAKRVKLITKSNRQIQSVVERGGSSSKVSWWQIK